MPQTGDYTADMMGAVAEKLPLLTDCNDLFSIATGHVKVACYGGSTLNSPYKEGLTAFAAGMIISYQGNTDYGTQMCFLAGNKICYRSKSVAGGISKWKFLTDTDTALMRDGSNAMTGTLKSVGDNVVAAIEKTRMMHGVECYIRLGLYKDLADAYGAIITKDTTNNGAEYGIGVSPITKKPMFLKLENGIFSNHNILHTGNKPSGYYTGNGSASREPIDTKGIGNVCIIYGGAGIAIVTANGAICGGGDGPATPRSLPTSAIRFNSGVLTIKTADSVVNGNGGWYDYYVL